MQQIQRICVMLGIWNLTKYYYNAENSLTRYIDAMKHSGKYYYNKINQLTQEKDGLDKATSYSFNAVGKISATTTANGDTISYQYNNLDRLTMIDYSDDTPDVTYNYSDQGEITRASNANVSYEYGYNSAGIRPSVPNTTLGKTMT